MKNKKQAKVKSKEFEEDYNLLMKDSSKFIAVSQEWKQKGDVISKYTLYNDPTPAKTSGSTTLLA